MSIRTTEEIARENIQGYLQDIAGYTNPSNDGLLAAWMMARRRAQDLVNDLDTVCKAIAARPPLTMEQVANLNLGLGQQALRAIATEIPEETPEEREALDHIESMHPQPGPWSPESLNRMHTDLINKMLASVRPA